MDTGSSWRELVPDLLGGLQFEAAWWVRDKGLPERLNAWTLVPAWSCWVDGARESGLVGPVVSAELLESGLVVP